MYIHEGQCTWYEKNEHSSLDNYNSFTKLSIVNRIYNFFYFLNKNNTIELRKLQTQCSLIKQKNPPKDKRSTLSDMSNVRQRESGHNLKI